MTGAYRVLRGYVYLCGLLVLFAIFASQVVFPGLYYDDGPIPPSSHRVLDAGRTLAYAILLLIPHRLGVKSIWYYIKLGILVIVSAWLIWCVGVGLHGFLLGKKDVLILPAMLGILALAISAPLTLVMRKRRF